MSLQVFYILGCERPFCFLTRRISDLRSNESNLLTLQTTKENLTFHHCLRLNNTSYRARTLRENHTRKDPFVELALTSLETTNIRFSKEIGQ